ncbi:MAG: adenylate/guanylate cyclase domain-containing protein [Geminicoccaceae bacterium]|nr:adenylate/guanylate cyclase domain-containing protein [Geminicoccaceae bacterium]
MTRGEVPKTPGREPVMRAGGRRRTFTHDYAAPVEAIWASMADTARYNEAAELPRHTIEEEVLEHAGIRFLARTRIGPFPLAWEDLPCNWVRNHWFSHRRLFSSGPLAALTAELRLEPSDEGCRGRYTIEVEPANTAGRLLLATGFFRSVERMFERLSRSADAFARGRQEVAFPIRPPGLGEEALRRLEAAVEALQQTPRHHGLAERLAALVRTAPETEVARIRPLALAARWAVEPRRVVELCLEATRAGLLDLRWDILCPRCRAAKAVVHALDELPKGAHCGTCNIDYERDFARNVELSFRPAPTIRPIEGGEFCLLGPMSMPHVLAHITLAPGEERSIEWTPGPGPYRLRTLEAGPQADLDHEGSGFPAVIVEPEAVRAGEAGAPGRVRLVNRTPWGRTAVIEDRGWAADALTADRVTAMQAFRDLFSDQVLRPGDEVGISRIALLFSDLEGSTALYGRIGDADAYHLVREHFAFMQSIVREFDGSVVKTIGDAVMAVFVEPETALRAALAMQNRLGARDDAERLRLKLGLHMGPCIAVTLNDRLDYFGSTVNMAARLQALSRGDDLVVSRELAADPAAGPLLEALAPQIERATLKGFEEPVSFLRLRFDEPAGAAAPDQQHGEAAQ